MSILFEEGAMTNREISVYAPIIALACILCACRHVDSLLHVCITARVMDAQTRGPIMGCTVAFTDARRAARGMCQSVGVTDDSGAVEVEFDYLWGRDLPSLVPDRTFFLQLSGTGYTTTRLPCKATSRSPGQPLEINLGVIYLERSKQMGESGRNTGTSGRGVTSESLGRQ